MFEATFVKDWQNFDAMFAEFEYDFPFMMNGFADIDLPFVGNKDLIAFQKFCGLFSDSQSKFL